LTSKRPLPTWPERRRRLMVVYAFGIIGLVFATYGATLAGDRGLARIFGTATAVVAGLWLVWLTLGR
jgi:hypothetical protein